MAQRGGNGLRFATRVASPPRENEGSFGAPGAGASCLAGVPCGGFLRGGETMKRVYAEVGLPESAGLA